MTSFEQPLPPWQAFGDKKPKMSPVHTGGTARPVWLCALALLPWARHCRGHCLNVMRPSGALLCVNSWTGLCQPPGVPWGMKQYPKALLDGCLLCLLSLTLEGGGQTHWGWTLLPSWCDSSGQ